MSHIPPTSNRVLASGSKLPRRQLGLLTAMAIVVASMIGTGVFTTSGFLLQDLQSRSLVVAAWFVGGIIAVMGAACYGALARRIPESGGEYVFLSQTLHPAAGWISGWLSVSVGFSAPLAMAAHAFGEYTSAWWPSMGARATGTLLLILFATAHAWHVRRGAHLQNVIVTLKIAALLVFIGWGFGRLPSLPPTDSAKPLFEPSAFSVSLVWISFSYCGWNAAVYLAGEIKDPDRNLPRSMILGTVIVASIYILLNAVFVYAAPMQALAGQVEIGRLSAEALGGEVWAQGASILVCVALTTTISSMTMLGPRVCVRMAEDGYLPAWLIRGHEEAPRRAILFQLTLALLFLWTLTFKNLLTYISFTLGLSTAASVWGLMRLRRREGRSLPVPGWPWLPPLFLFCVLATTSITIIREPGACALGLGTLAAGWLVWRWKVSPNSKPSPR